MMVEPRVMFALFWVAVGMFFSCLIGAMVNAIIDIREARALFDKAASETNDDADASGDPDSNLK